MTHSFLLEIGLEEIPAHVVTPSVNQLVKKVKDYLKQQRMSFEEVHPYSTPRRLAVEVTGLAEKQDNIEEVAKGPSKKIALDADGNWTKAAEGFVRGQGMTVDDIYFKELKGEEYVYVDKFIKGKPVKEVLVGLSDVVMDLKFPTMMRWGTNDFEYVRPIKWLVALLDEEVVPFKVLNIETGRQSKGHRFLGHDVEINKTSSYLEQLKEVFVIADAKERKDDIRQQINELAAKNNWVVDIDEDLLEEVNNLVEYPTVFSGSFNEKYLSVPNEVLITSMKDHQRFFYVQDQEGKLLPNFISVRNGNTDYLENVISGNEKVLTARLEDAKFFYEEDQKNTISDYVERLKKVMFHDKIGSIYEKMERVNLIAEFLGKKVGLTDKELKDLDRASMIYKFDLVTGMVGEFSELQGVMGEIYAKLQKESENVSVAMREEYMPTSAEGELPKTNVGALLSIADKLDSLQAFFAANMIPSGSNDPYALRRQTLGIIRIALNKQWDISVPMLEEAIQYASQKRSDLYKNIMPVAKNDERTKFISDRLYQILDGNGNYRRDVLEAVVSNMNASFNHIKDAANVLSAHVSDDNFKDVIEALTRVVRLSAKANDVTGSEVDSSLLENDSEKQLLKAYVETAQSYESMDYEAKYQALVDLKDVIVNYFEQTMVMDKNEQVKNNRLLQVKLIAKLTESFGSLDKLNLK